MDFEAIARHVAETIERSGSAKAVFGEPLKLQTQTIVPVAVVEARVGAGMGHAPVVGGGGGGGMNLRVLPIGYIHERDGAVVFSPIELPEDLRASQAAAGAARPREQRPLVAQMLNLLRERRHGGA